MRKHSVNALWKLAGWLSGGLLALTVMAVLDIGDALLKSVQERYGASAKERVLNWQKLVLTGKNLSDLEKLTLVNDFFNRHIEFISDSLHWYTEDYWATPLETLSTGAGDCEDYAIAKYFTLIELGIDDKKMRITYVKALKLDQAHMVLTYFATPKSAPLVLDNLIAAIKPADERKDLLPVYSFNGTGLWLAKDRGTGKQVGGSGRLSLWSDVKQRMLQIQTEPQ